MKFASPAADVFVPDGAPLAAALARTTHLCLAAHQDDIEIMAYHGIAECFGQLDRCFTGVVLTDGSGSPRAGKFAKFTDEEMKAVRRAEQRKAAKLGRYSAVIQLAHPSVLVKNAKSAAVAHDLASIFAHCSPHTVYLHNPADKHDTHVACFRRCIEALRKLPITRRPKVVYGCEVWRDLDWLGDAEKVALDVSANPKLAAKLVAVFQSQIAGGKRYDLATAGRRLANATFHTSHTTDRAAALTWAMDLTPLLRNGRLSVGKFALAGVERLRADIAKRIRRLG